MAKTKSKKVRDHAGELADRLAPHVEAARDKAAPVIADAREKAGPVIADARDKAAPVVDAARDRFTSDVLPAMTAAVAATAAATEDVRGEAKKRGKAAAAALKGEIEAPEKKTHKFRNLLILLGLGGIAAAVAKKLGSRDASTAWQSSYTPPAAPSGPTPVPPVDDTPTATAAAASAHDEAAAAPGEAASDAAEEPHAATTPDDPAEEIDLKKD